MSFYAFEKNGEYRVILRENYNVYVYRRELVRRFGIEQLARSMTRSELFSLLEKEGWTQIRSNGSHAMFEREGIRQRVAIGGRGMGGGGLKEILRRFEINVEGVTVPNKKGQVLSLDQLAARGIKLPKLGTEGRKLFDARRALGLTHNDVAVKLGVSSALVGQWEKGFTGISDARKEQLNKMFPELFVVKRMDQQITSVETGDTHISHTETAIASKDEKPVAKHVEPRAIKDLDHPETLAAKTQEVEKKMEIPEEKEFQQEAKEEAAPTEPVENKVEFPEELETLRTAILDKKHKLGYTESAVSKDMAVGMETLADLIHRRKTEFAPSSINLMKFWAGISVPAPAPVPVPPIEISAEGDHAEKLKTFNEWLSAILVENEALRTENRNLKKKAEKWDFFKEMATETD